MRIGIIGAGSMGMILARHLAQRGHHVSMANSRGPASLTVLAAEIGATPVSVADAAKAGEIIVLAIPTKAVAELPKGLFAKVPGSVVVIDDKYSLGSFPVWGRGIRHLVSDSLHGSDRVAL